MDDCSPLSWAEFFDRKEAVQIGEDVFNVYVKGSSGPLFFLLHGGGYTGLTWAVLSEQLSSGIECQILAPDLREHGETEVKNGSDMSAESQVNDVCNIYWHFYGKDKRKHPPIILIGHSMGGAIAIRTAATGKLPNVLVVSAIDVVEGSAMSSLCFMQQFLRSRPQHFPSIERSVEWCVKSKTTSNLRAAKVSMPCRLKKVVDRSKGEFMKLPMLFPSHFHPITCAMWAISALPMAYQFGTYRTCEPVKVLILANVDRLDKELLTGQMRGQFQLEVLPKVGHAVHEDSPDLVAKIFVTLVKRYNVIFQKYL